MERIIYFYVAREWKENTPACKVHSCRRRNYELLRIGLAPWFVKKWESAALQPGEPPEQNEKGNFFAVLPGILARMQKKQRIKKAEAAERLFWQQQFDGVIEQIAACLESGKETGFWEERFFSCEEQLLPLLLPGKKGQGFDMPVKEIWEQRWKVPLFDNFLELRWVEHLAQRAVLPHFLILGYHRDLPEMFCKWAAGMKSLKWILPERVYTRSLQDFLEDFYDEYGIAVAVQVLKEEESYRQAQIACREPSNILDFSEEERLPTGKIARESIWLDMASSEEKCRRLESRNTGIHYFSVKQEWKQPVLP